MKTGRRIIIASLLAMLMLFSSACSQSSQPALVGDNTEPSAGSSEAPVAAGENSTGTYSSDTVDIVDAAGRTVTIPSPDKLERVYPTSSTTLVLMYTLAMDEMTASPSVFTEKHEKYIAPEVIDLPTYGTLSGSNGTLDYEAIKAADVQLLLSGGASKLSQSDIDSANEIQDQLGIPVVLFDTANMDNMPETYRLLGKILGKEDEAERIISYFQNILDTVTDFAATIPEEQRMTLYYAEGSEGLATEPANSDRSVVFNTAGAINVAEVEALTGFGQSAVSMEQVLNWDPDIIIVQGGSGAYDIILSDPDWANITAVKEGRVYTMPNIPFSWADRPPSENRFIGLLWVAALLYGDAFETDIVEAAIDYYENIYHIKVSREDMEALLETSIPHS